jgi:hypothetical protein
MNAYEIIDPDGEVVDVQLATSAYRAAHDYIGERLEREWEMLDVGYEFPNDDHGALWINGFKYFVREEFKEGQ